MSKKPNPQPMTRGQSAIIAQAMAPVIKAIERMQTASGPGGSTEQKPTNPGDMT